MRRGRRRLEWLIWIDGECGANNRELGLRIIPHPGLDDRSEMVIRYDERVDRLGNTQI